MKYELPENLKSEREVTLALQRAFKGHTVLMVLEKHQPFPQRKEKTHVENGEKYRPFYGETDTAFQY